jgi:N-acetylglucosaminyldiphosphoundecaprenol N-acetyl-beta-D-mannosaminyltransferase
MSAAPKESRFGPDGQLQPGREPVSSRYVLGTRVDATSYSATAREVLSLAGRHESRYICVANVHMVMEAVDSRDFREIVNKAELVTPDGMPLVWALRCLGVGHATRVYGPELVLAVCDLAAADGVPIGLYGGHPQVLERLVTTLSHRFPGLTIAFAESPPFRPLTAQEDGDLVERIQSSGARILFVGLGCPKQERWMAAHVGSISAVMLGVGAALDFLTGSKPQAPRWMRESGLEWLFRLLTEPRRLWRRYLIHNPRFMVLFAWQLLKRVAAPSS